MLTAPIYELSVKEPARSSKDRTQLYKEKLKESGNYFDASTKKNWDIQYAMQQYENIDKLDFKKTNAFLNKVAPGFQKYLLELPLIYLNIESYEQLSQDISAFKTPFLFLPHLDGPTAVKAINL